MAYDKRIADINKMYDEMQKKRNNDLAAARDKALRELSGQSSKIGNNYTDTQNRINQQRQGTYNKYQDMYTGLDNDYRKGKQEYYTQRNGASYQNAKNVQAIREYMARQNLLSSGESVDAMLRQNSDFSNSMGAIYGAESDFNKGLIDTRNRYSSEEANIYAQYDNNLASALAERDRLLAELEAQRKGYWDDYNAGLGSVKSEIESQRIKDINAYQEQLRREAWEAEQARLEREWQSAENAKNRSYSYSGGSGGSGGSSDLSNTDLNNIANEVNRSITTMQDIGSTKELVINAYNNGDISSDTYNDWMGKLNSALDQVKQSQRNQNKGNYPNTNMTETNNRPNPNRPQVNQPY